jgi:pimeloyl-ACP methyl ester carboxylesterase
MTPTGFILRDGLRLAVHDAGGPGASVLFQHGLCGDAGQTAEAFPALDGFRRVTLDCRGHGASEAGDDLSIATFADDVAALAASLAPPLILGGISMGAAIATRIAVTRPDLVRALVLVRPAWVADPAPANMAPNAEVGALLSSLPPAAARAAFEAGPTHARLSREAPDNLASLLGFFDRTPADVTARLLTRISVDGPGVTEHQLAALTVPTLICGTAEDWVHPYAHAERLASLIPGATLVELPPKGRDKPAHLTALHAAIARFLKEL